MLDSELFADERENRFVGRTSFPEDMGTSFAETQPIKLLLEVGAQGVIPAEAHARVPSIVAEDEELVRLA